MSKSPTTSRAQFDAWIQTKPRRYRASTIDLAWQAWKDAASLEREACAALCEKVVTYPPGHDGLWEGYGPVQRPRDGKACAAAIRRRSTTP